MALATVLAAAGLFAGGVPAWASPVGLRGDRADIAAVQQKLAQLGRRSAAAYEDYNNALYQLNRLDDRLARTDRALKRARRELESSREALREQAARVYRSGNVGFVDVLVGTRSFSEFASRLNMLVNAFIQQRESYEKMRAAEQALVSRKAALEEQRRHQSVVLKKAEARRELAARLRRETSAYLDSLDARVSREIEARQERQAALARRQAEAARRALHHASPAPVVAAGHVSVTGMQTSAAEEAARAERRKAEEAARRAAALQRAAQRAAERKADVRRVMGRADEHHVSPSPPGGRLGESQLAKEREAARAALQAKLAAARKARVEARMAARRAAIQRAAAERAAAERKAALRAAARRRAAEEAAAEEAAKEASYAASTAPVSSGGGTDVASSANSSDRAQSPPVSPEPAAQSSTKPASASASPAVSSDASPASSAPVSSASSYGGTVPGSSGSSHASSQPSDGYSSAPAGSPSGSTSGYAVVEEARTWLGVPYVWGGASRQGVDCSGLTMEVYAHFGIYLPHSAAGQYSYGSPVSSPGPGDLVFMNFDGGSDITHVGIVVGSGQMIDAPYPGTVVRYDPIYPQYTIGYRRLL